MVITEQPRMFLLRFLGLIFCVFRYHFKKFSCKLPKRSITYCQLLPRVMQLIVDWSKNFVSEYNILPAIAQSDAADCGLVKEFCQ